MYLHDRMTPATLSPTPLAYEKPIHPTEMPQITTCTELPVDDTNKSTSDDKYPWLDPDDIRRNMTDSEILQMKLNLKDSVLDEKGKEEFLTNVEQFTNIFSLRDEIGTCPFIEVHLKLKDETPFFVRPYPMREEQKKVIQKEMDRLKHLGIIHKGLTSYSSPVVLVKWKNQNLYLVCSDFRILNEKLVKINHAFLLVRDCICHASARPPAFLSTTQLCLTFPPAWKELAEPQGSKRVSFNKCSKWFGAKSQLSSLGLPQPIGGFPAIESRMFQHKIMSATSRSL